MINEMSKKEAPRLKIPCFDDGEIRHIKSEFHTHQNKSKIQEQNAKESI